MIFCIEILLLASGDKRIAPIRSSCVCGIIPVARVNGLRKFKVTVGKLK